MIVNLLRNGIGKILACGDQLTRPPKMQRDPARQAQVDEQAEKLSLYQYHGCPFCIKVRRELHRLNVDIELRDARKNATHRKELLEKGGRSMVPCLRIDEDGKSRWMYESSDIITWLREQFGDKAA